MRNRRLDPLEMCTEHHDQAIHGSKHRGRNARQISFAGDSKQRFGQAHSPRFASGEHDPYNVVPDGQGLVDTPQPATLDTEGGVVAAAKAALTDYFGHD